MTRPGAEPGTVIRTRRSARLQFAEMILVLEACVVLFAALTAFALRVAEPAVVWGVGAALAVVLVVLSRLVGRRGGYVLGSAAQVLVLAGGFWLGMMWVVGGVFAVLWLVALRLGGRIDAERAAFDAAHPDAEPPLTPPRRH